MNWSQVQVGAWWPLLIGAFAIVVMIVIWHRRKGQLFPDVHLLSNTAGLGGMLDRLPLIMGITVVSLLILTLMDISTVRSVMVNKRARDFLVIVDTSRSMREHTTLLRSEYPPTYPRRTGPFSGQTDEPGTIPQLARYELAREGLLRFMSTLNDEEDRVELIYFNSQVYLMSGFTTNFPFLRQQLENMDPYVTYGTNIRWALETGLDMLDRYPSTNRRAVILLTDAEARSTQNLQEQLDRLGRTDVSFYLLWITSDNAGEVSAQAGEFLRNVRSIGSVFTIADLAEGSLDDAMRDIGKLENYAYEEHRFERIDLSEYIFSLSRWLMLVWVLLVATLYHPAGANLFGVSNKR